MSRPRFLTDEDLNHAIITGLLHVEPRVELFRVRDAGLGGMSDPDVLEYAARHDLIVVTHDRNTMTAHASDRIKNKLPMPGVVVVPQKTEVRAASSGFTQSGRRWTGKR